MNINTNRKPHIMHRIIRFTFAFHRMALLTMLVAFLKPFSAKSAIPENCRQLIVVIAETMDGPNAKLYRFERNSSSATWQPYQSEFPVIIGKNGLGWSSQALRESASSGTVKAEGDGKSPAGIFELGPAFGFQSVSESGIQNYPYIEITQMTECIDDPASGYYNTILSKNSADTVDWNSSEKMRRASPWYELGVVINHNTSPVRPAAGSCIFLHNWAALNDSTVGCTAMNPVNMLKIIRWLNREIKPVLVQLDIDNYQRLTKVWGLPEINSELKVPVAPGILR